MNHSSTLWIGRCNFFLITLCTPLLACTTLLVRSVQTQPEQARSADSLINSIGVATHLRYTDGPYGRYSDVIKPRLQELGVRHIRDGGNDATFFQKLNDLATLGIKSTLVMDPRDGTQPQDAVTIAKTIPNSIGAVEGPNEWDKNPNAAYEGQSFPNGLRNYQNDLYKAIKSDPATAAIPVLMPSLAGPGNASKLGLLSSIDKGNIHTYNGPHKPGWGMSEYVIPQIQKASGDKPLVTTETGWSNSWGVSQQLEAKYVPRLYLEHFNRGIERTFLYEFLTQETDGNPENNFGLLNYDGSRQPAFIALKNLILLLKDPGTSFSLEPLDYTLSGDTAGVNHTLLQKRSGVFYLVLWQDAEGRDNKNEKDTIVAKQNVSLSLNTVISKVSFYLPTYSVTSTWQSGDQSGPIKRLRISIPDHPLVIELAPAGRT